jgi:hypothetical protein
MRDQHNGSVIGTQSKVTFFSAEVKIWIFSTLGATVDIELLALLSLLRLLLLLVLLAARLRQLLYFHLLPTGLSALRFSSPMIPVCVFFPGTL